MRDRRRQEQIRQVTLVGVALNVLGVVALGPSLAGLDPGTVPWLRLSMLFNASAAVCYFRAFLIGRR